MAERQHSGGASEMPSATAPEGQIDRAKGPERYWPSADVEQRLESINQRINACMARMRAPEWWRLSASMANCQRTPSTEAAERQAPEIERNEVAKSGHAPSLEQLNARGLAAENAKCQSGREPKSTKRKS